MPDSSTSKSPTPRIKPLGANQDREWSLDSYAYDYSMPKLGVEHSLIALVVAVTWINAFLIIAA